MAREAAGTKKQREQLLTTMGAQGCTPEQIAVEMGRRFGFRPRQAWRHTHGWTQEQAAAAYNRLLDDDQAPMSGKRISDFETWPQGGVKPTPTTLAMLAAIYSTTPTALIDLDDRGALSPQELIALNIHTPSCSPKSSGSPSQNSTTALATMDDEHTPPDVATVLGQSERTSHRLTQSAKHRLMVGTTPAWQPRHWRLMMAWLMAMVTALGGVVMMTRASMTGSRPIHPSGPLAIPSALPPVPHAPAQQQKTISTVPPPPLHPPVQRIPTPRVSRPAPASHTPSSSLGSSNVVPLSSQPAATDHVSAAASATDNFSAATAAGVVLKNMYSGLCLDEQDDTTSGDDSGVLRLQGCNGSANQRWRGRLIAVRPPFVILNLVSSRSGRCVTYQPGSVSGLDPKWWTQS